MTTKHPITQHMGYPARPDLSGLRLGAGGLPFGTLLPSGATLYMLKPLYLIKNIKEKL